MDIFGQTNYQQPTVPAPTTAPDPTAMRGPKKPTRTARSTGNQDAFQSMPMPALIAPQPQRVISWLPVLGAPASAPFTFGPPAFTPLSSVNAPTAQVLSSHPGMPQATAVISKTASDSTSAPALAQQPKAIASPLPPPKDMPEISARYQALQAKIKGLDEKDPKFIRNVEEAGKEWYAIKEKFQDASKAPEYSACRDLLESKLGSILTSYANRYNSVIEYIDKEAADFRACRAACLSNDSLSRLINDQELNCRDPRRSYRDAKKELDKCSHLRLGYVIDFIKMAVEQGRFDASFYDRLLTLMREAAYLKRCPPPEPLQEAPIGLLASVVVRDDIFSGMPFSCQLELYEHCICLHPQETDGANPTFIALKSFVEAFRPIDTMIAKHPNQKNNDLETEWNQFLLHFCWKNQWFAPLERILRSQDDKEMWYKQGLKQGEQLIYTFLMAKFARGLIYAFKGDVSQSDAREDWHTCLNMIVFLTDEQKELLRRMESLINEKNWDGLRDFAAAPECLPALRVVANEFLR